LTTVTFTNIETIIPDMAIINMETNIVKFETLVKQEESLLKELYKIRAEKTRIFNEINVIKCKSV